MQEKGNAMTTISIDKLIRLVGTLSVRMLIDVRPKHDFDAEPRLIPSSVRCGPDKLTDLAGARPEHSAIVICQNGSSLNQGVAALLPIRRIPAEAAPALFRTLLGG